jgi:hypothetical protein
MSSLFKPSKKQFVKQLTKELDQAGVETLYEPDEFRLKLGAEPSGTINLHNFYANFCQARGHNRGQVLAGMVQIVTRAVSGVPVAWEEAKSLLIPRLFSRGYVEQGRVEGNPVPHKLLTENVAIVLGLDYPDSIWGVSDADLKHWGVELDQVLKVARDNLWARSNETLVEWEPGVFRGNWGDNNDAARILLQPLLLKLELKGDPVAWAPDRGALFVTGAEDQAGISKVAEFVLKSEFQRPVTVAPLRLVGENWQRFEVAQDHVLSGVLRRLAFEDRCRDYAEQKEYLDEWLERQGKDVFVANCMSVTNSKTGEFFTAAVWGEGVDALLPETDRLFIMDESRPQNERVAEDLNWAEARAKLGDRMVATDYWPVRWKMGEWE